MNKLKLNDIHIGMRIQYKSQLDNIYDTWILLIKDKITDEYIIGFIGKETNTQSDKLFGQGNKICTIYNDSTEFNNKIYYDD